MLEAEISSHAPQVGGLLVLFLVIIPLYRLLSSPVAKVPGPWHTKLTSLVKTYHDAIGTTPSWVLSLHQQYGDVVCIAPNMVDVWTPADARQIHHINNKKPFVKTEWYLKLVPPGSVTIFSTADVDLHRRYRKLLSNPLSESGLKTMLPNVERKVSLAMAGMKAEMARRGAVDIARWWTSLATDVIGELSFGSSFGTLEAGGSNQYLDDLAAVNTSAGLRATFPIFSYIPPQLIPVPVMRKAYGVAYRLVSYAEASVRRLEDMVHKAADDEEAAPKTLFTKVLKAQAEDSLTHLEVRNHAMSYIVAGSDTTAMTLTYLVWRLCLPQHADIRAKLMAEIADTLVREGDEFDDDKLRGMAYLDRVITEALRVHSAAPGGLPRYVPEGGATFYNHDRTTGIDGEKKEKNQRGYYLPAGTTIQTSAYSMHRNPSVFSDPETFNPDRWENPTKEMKEAFMPFGGGSRICVGLHLAHIELRMAVVNFFKNFPEAEVSDREGFVSEVDMEAETRFLMSPRGHRCLIDAR